MQSSVQLQLKRLADKRSVPFECGQISEPLRTFGPKSGRFFVCERPGSQHTAPGLLSRWERVDEVVALQLGTHSKDRRAIVVERRPGQRDEPPR